MYYTSIKKPNSVNGIKYLITTHGRGRNHWLSLGRQHTVYTHKPFIYSLANLNIYCTLNFKALLVYSLKQLCYTYTIDGLIAKTSQQLMLYFINLPFRNIP